jgi:hypothetical protein
MSSDTKVTLNDICDLEYTLFSYMIEQYHYLVVKHLIEEDHPIITLKELYRQVGFFRQDFLGLLPEYRAHLDSEFMSIKSDVDYFIVNFKAQCKHYIGKRMKHHV